MTPEARTAGCPTSNPDAARNCRRSSKPLPLISAAMQKAQSLWPEKTEHELRVRTKVRSLRTCRYWISQTYGISGEALAELLFSEEGLEFLNAMAEARGAVPTWWGDFINQISISVLRRQQEEQRIRLEAAERKAAVPKVR